MFLLLLAWGVVALLLIGWGMLVAQGWRVAASVSGSTALWLGVTILLALAQIWHLWLPITPLTTFIVIVVGVVGLIRVKARWEWLPRRSVWGWGAVLLVVVMVFAVHAMRPPIFYDNGLYHLQAIQWIKQYAIVPGLGNLHGRLAFNSSYFPLVALFDIPLSGLRGYHSVNGLLTVALVAEGIRALSLCGTRQLKGSALLSILLLYPLITVALDPLANYLSAPTTDYSVWLISLKLALEGLRWAEAPAEKPIRPLLIVMLAVGLITIKLSGALFVLGGVGVLLVAALRTRTLTWGWRGWGLVGVATLFLLPWVGRSVLLSGYVVYPAMLGALPVDWRVTEAQAADDTNFVLSWARYPVAGSHWREVLANNAWFPSWQVNFWRTKGIRLSLLITGVSWGIVLAHTLWQRRMPTGVQRLLLWTLAPLVGIGAWWFSAPDPRFALAYFWLVALGGIVAAYESLPHFPQMVQSVTRRHYVMPLVAMGLCLFLLWSRPDSSSFSVSPIPAAPVVTHHTASGLPFALPQNGELCWDAPLPCTPHLNPLLRLRDATNLGAGFTVRPPH